MQRRVSSVPLAEAASGASAANNKGTIAAESSSGSVAIPSTLTSHVKSRKLKDRNKKKERARPSLSVLDGFYSSWLVKRNMIPIIVVPMTAGFALIVLLLEVFGNETLGMIGIRGGDANGGIDEGIPHGTIKRRHEAQFPPSDTARLFHFVQSLRTTRYEPIFSTNDMPYDMYNCPEHPPSHYPGAWNILDVLNNWNPDDTAPIRQRQIYQGLCIFNHTTEYHKALHYRNAEVPFVLRDDPVILQTVERWNTPNYLSRILGTKQKHRTEYSTNNHFMFWRTRQFRQGQLPEGWARPTENIEMTFQEWSDKANLPEEDLDVNHEHWYFRLNAGGYDKSNDFLYEELPWFKPVGSFYMVEPEHERGINCRFGMKGNIAENHFDASRNFIVLLGGERRYILAHPDQCQNLVLYPPNHPSARHSEVDWSNPDLDAYPLFKDAVVNEVVLQPGDVLYLPTSWFHFIVSLNKNYQCNARSGATRHYAQFIEDCGF